MYHLKKTWVRVIISLVAAGISMELLWIATAKNVNAERPPQTSLGILVLAVLFYFLLTKVVDKK